MRVAAAAKGIFPTARRSLPPMREEMTKCDFCRDYLDKANPVLRRGLPPAARWITMNTKNLLKRYGKQASIVPLPRPEFTRPYFTCASNLHSKPQGSTEGLHGKHISNPGEI